MQLLTTKTNAQKTISTNHSESNHKEPQKVDSNMQKYMQNEIIEFLQNQWRSIFFVVKTKTLCVD